MLKLETAMLHSVAKPAGNQAALAASGTQAATPAPHGPQPAGAQPAAEHGSADLECEMLVLGAGPGGYSARFVPPTWA